MPRQCHLKNSRRKIDPNMLEILLCGPPTPYLSNLHAPNVGEEEEGP